MNGVVSERGQARDGGAAHRPAGIREVRDQPFDVTLDHQAIDIGGAGAFNLCQLNAHVVIVASRDATDCGWDSSTDSMSACSVFAVRIDAISRATSARSEAVV